jgi:hypothetical protein
MTNARPLTRALQSLAQVEPPKRPRSPMGEALHCYDERASHVENLYAQANGEVTDEIEEAEAARDLSRHEAMERLIHYLRWCDGRDLQSAAERKATIERLDKFDASTAKRREFAQAKLVALARVDDPKAKKARVGTFTVKISETHACEATKDLDLRALPPGWLRPVAEVPAVPATVALDKKAAKADMLLGYREGPPPHDGWYDAENMGRVWLAERLFEGREWLWSLGEHDDMATWLHDIGYSIEPEPGMDVLRWKPSPPGVTLVHRTHVKVE